MKKRYFALLDATKDASYASHFLGMPPEISVDPNTRRNSPSPSVLVIEQDDDGFSLFRFARDGSCVGDTWHLNIDDAHHQAHYEYGHALMAWNEIPTEDSDIVAFILRQIS